VGAGLGDGVVEGVEHRDALDVLAALARRHARHDLRAVALVVHRVERALAPRDAGDAELRVVVDEDAHSTIPVSPPAPRASLEMVPVASSTTLRAAPSI